MDYIKFHESVVCGRRQKTFRACSHMNTFTNGLGSNERFSDKDENFNFNLFAFISIVFKHYITE